MKEFDENEAEEDFHYFQKMLLKHGSEFSPLQREIQRSYEILMYRASSLALTSMLEILLTHLDNALPAEYGSTSCGNTQHDYRSSVLYDCLAIAVEKNHDNVIRVLLEFITWKPTDTTSAISWSSKGRYTPLHCAAAVGDVNIATLLINTGVDVNQTNGQGETALHLAADAAIAKVLIRYGADLNALTVDDLKPLSYACLGCRLGVVRQLLDNGAQPNIGSTFVTQSWNRCLDPNAELSTACEVGTESSIASALVQSSKNGPWRFTSTCANFAMCEDKGGCVICLTCKKENYHITEHILTNDANRSKCCTPLHSAISNFHKKKLETGIVDIEIIKSVLSKAEHAININAVDSCDGTALYRAVQRNLIDVAAVLLDAGADPNLITSGKYPLVVACRFYSHEFVKLLLARGADPNVIDSFGNSPLFVAALSFDHRLVKLLIEHGADVNQRDKQGRTALHAISEFWPKCSSAAVGCVETARCLLDNGCNVNQATKTGLTVLYWTYQRYLCSYQRNRFSRGSTCFSLFKLLLERGADVRSIKNRENPLCSAAFDYFYCVVRELMRHGGDPYCDSGMVDCMISDEHFIRLLLSTGADINLFDRTSLATSLLKKNVTVIDLLLNSGMNFSVPSDSLKCKTKRHGRRNGSKATVVPNLRQLFVPLCKETESIIHLFKGGSNLEFLSLCCKNKTDLRYETCCGEMGGRLCQAIVLGGQNVQQQQLVKLLTKSTKPHDLDLASWLAEDSMTPSSLCCLSRTVVRRQLSAASRCRTILPLIDVLPIPNQVRMYLRFEGPCSEVDLDGCKGSTSCCCH